MRRRPPPRPDSLGITGAAGMGFMRSVPPLELLGISVLNEQFNGGRKRHRSRREQRAGCDPQRQRRRLSEAPKMAAVAQRGAGLPVGAGPRGGERAGPPAPTRAMAAAQEPSEPGKRKVTRGAEGRGTDVARVRGRVWGSGRRFATPGPLPGLVVSPPGATNSLISLQSFSILI